MGASEPEVLSCWSGWSGQGWGTQYGYQGSDKDSDQLNLTDSLLHAALCEFAVVGRDQPTVVVRDIALC